jgi:hypothetical protein
MIQRPRPVPLISLVEKKGSKIRGIFCGAIPCPESAIVTRIPFPVPLEATGLIRTVRVPPLVDTLTGVAEVDSRWKRSAWVAI